MRRVEQVAAMLSLVAGGLHAMAGPAHLAEWWAYGLFFYAAAAAQAAFGLLLLTRGIEGWGGWDAVRRRVYVAGICFTLAIIAVWVVSRTVGVPVGPAQGEPEGVGALDAASKAVELTLCAALAWLVSRASPPAPAA